MRLRLLLSLTTLLIAVPAASAMAAPNASTGGVSNVTTTTATLKGAVNPKGAPTNGYFQYGTTRTYTSRTPGQPLGNSTGGIAITAAVTQLTPDTVYHYRVVGNGAGTTFGADRTFRTDKVAAPTLPAPPEPSKLQLQRATISSANNTIDVLAPITARASGSVSMSLNAAGQTHTWTAAINSNDGVIRSTEVIPSAQAKKGSGILTITYAGDADTRPQSIRLRAANTPSNLDASRPTYVNGLLHDAGTVASSAKGIVRVQLEYVNASNQTVTIEKNATISGGSWVLDTTLSPEEQAAIAARRGVLHSYILFTGYLPAGLRGEEQSYEVLGAP